MELSAQTVAGMAGFPGAEFEVGQPFLSVLSFFISAIFIPGKGGGFPFFLSLIQQPY
jgi:hypothetical protein